MNKSAAYAIITFLTILSCFVSIPITHLFMGQIDWAGPIDWNAIGGISIVFAFLGLVGGTITYFISRSINGRQPISLAAVRSAFSRSVIVGGMFFVIGAAALTSLATHSAISRKIEEEKSAIDILAKERLRWASLTDKQRVAEQNLAADRAKAAQDAAETLALDAKNASDQAVLAAELDSARFVCPEFARKALHDPDSALFDHYKEYWAERKKSGLINVQVRLRAKNGFGALRKITMQCTVMHLHSPDKWVAVELKETH